MHPSARRRRTLGVRMCSRCSGCTLNVPGAPPRDSCRRIRWAVAIGGRERIVDEFPLRVGVGTLIDAQGILLDGAANADYKASKNGAIDWR